MTPAITRAADGGLTPGRNSLELAVNFSSRTEGLTVTFTFSAAYTDGVSNVSFSIFDIDKQATSNSNFEDQVRSIYATLTNRTQIAAMSFVYGSGSGAAADPTYQHIGIGNIDYSPVPEINRAWTALASCSAAGVLVLRHRAKFQN
jgi:hypothetical protein